MQWDNVFNRCVNTLLRSTNPAGGMLMQLSRVISRNPSKQQRWCRVFREAWGASLAVCLPVGGVFTLEPAKTRKRVACNRCKGTPKVVPQRKSVFLALTSMKRRGGVKGSR